MRPRGLSVRLMKNSRIEWTDHTFNPWIGCAPISLGCDNCYARRDFCDRKHVVEWGAGTERHRTSPNTWHQPLLWEEEAKRTATTPRVFCASLADWADPEVPDAWRMDLFGLIKRTPHLRWLLLSKREGSMLRWFRQFRDPHWPWAHIWLGLTIEHNEYAPARYWALHHTEAAGRFISCEPLLSKIDVYPWINWVIAGGESGELARPCEPAYARDLRDQCQDMGIPFFWKGWGEYAPRWEIPETVRVDQAYGGKDGLLFRVGRRNPWRKLDGFEHNEVPQ